MVSVSWLTLAAAVVPAIAVGMRLDWVGAVIATHMLLSVAFYLALFVSVRRHSIPRAVWLKALAAPLLPLSFLLLERAYASFEQKALKR